MAETGPQARLATALENMALAQPPEPFAGQYTLLNERVAAGQAIVNFAQRRCGAPPSHDARLFARMADLH